MHGICVLKVFAVPAQRIDEFVFDVGMLGGDVQFLLEDPANGFGHLVAQVVIGCSEQLYLHHGDGETVVSTEPHTAIVAEIEHEPIFVLSGEERDGLSQACLEDGFLFLAEADVERGIDEWHDIVLLVF